MLFSKLKALFSLPLKIGEPVYSYPPKRPNKVELLPFLFFFSSSAKFFAAIKAFSFALSFSIASSLIFFIDSSRESLTKSIASFSNPRVFISSSCTDCNWVLAFSSLSTKSISSLYLPINSVILSDCSFAFCAVSSIFWRISSCFWLNTSTRDIIVVSPTAIHPNGLDKNAVLIAIPKDWKDNANPWIAVASPFATIIVAVWISLNNCILIIDALICLGNDLKKFKILLPFHKANPVAIKDNTVCKFPKVSIRVVNAWIVLLIKSEFSDFCQNSSNVALNLSSLACTESWYIANFCSAVPAEFKAAS